MKQKEGIAFMTLLKRLHICKAANTAMRIVQRSTYKFKNWRAENPKKAIAILISVAAAFLTLLTTIIVIVLYFNSILPSNAQFCGISLGGMNAEEVSYVVDNEINPRFSSASVDFIFQGTSYPFDVSQIQASYNPEEVFIKAKECDFSKGEKPDVPLDYKEDVFNAQIDSLFDTAKVATTPYSYKQKGSVLTLKAGTQGITFDKEKAKQDILSSIKSVEFAAVTASEQPLIDDSIPINIDAVHAEISHPVKNADYTINSSGKITYNQEITGVDFDVEQAKTIVTDPSSGEYQVPLIITPPSVTVEQLKKEHDNASCPTELSTYTTKYSNSDDGRCYNIKKSAEAINGTVLYPGEEFSFLNEVGPAGKEQGYKESTVYTSSGVDKGYGGGICQVSTTTYLAALYGYFPITERHNHSYTVGYVPLGFDAAVSWGGTDLKFKNNRPDPVKIVASADSGTITVSIFGSPSEYDNYNVTMTSEKTSVTPSTDIKYVENSSLPQGTQRVKTQGKEGCSVVAHKVVTHNGQVVEESDIKSNYKPVTKVVEVGTAAV